MWRYTNSIMARPLAYLLICLQLFSLIRCAPQSQASDSRPGPIIVITLAKITQQAAIGGGSSQAQVPQSYMTTQVRATAAAAATSYIQASSTILTAAAVTPAAAAGSGFEQGVTRALAQDWYSTANGYASYANGYASYATSWVPCSTSSICEQCCQQCQPYSTSTVYCHTCQPYYPQKTYCDKCEATQVPVYGQFCSTEYANGPNLPTVGLGGCGTILILPNAAGRTTETWQAMLLGSTLLGGVVAALIL